MKNRRVEKTDNLEKLWYQRVLIVDRNGSLGRNTTSFRVMVGKVTGGRGRGCIPFQRTQSEGKL